MASARLPLLDNTRSAYVHITVAPGNRRRGIGRRLYAAAEQALREAARTVLLAETEHPAVRAAPGTDPGGQHAVAGDAVAARSGFGTVPDDAAAGFARNRGFELEQVERISRLQLDGGTAALRRHLEAAEVAAGSDYRLQSWLGFCPENLVEDYALLRQRMSIEAPMAGLDLEEERWDAARVREGERRVLAMKARELVSAVRHVPTGALVGHTVLMVFEGNPAVAFQDDTLVLAAHRGHRLGLLLKVANLLRLRGESPSTERVWTWNAVENRYMLAINELLGFAAVGYSGEWQKRLSGHDGQDG